LLAADGIPRLTDIHLTGGLFLDPLPVEGPGAAGLGYLAPEVLQGPGAEPRPHTDVYGLGLILYELLTGTPAFAGATAAETLERAPPRHPAPPSRLNPQVTPHLEAFCLRCLRKNPWRRYARAYDVLVRLRYFRDNPEDRALPGQRWSRRPPGPGDRPEGQV